MCAVNDSGADFGIAVTGIAGPSGGTFMKPVGTVFIAISDRCNCLVEEYQFDGDRDSIRMQAARAAMELCFEKVLEY